MTHVLVPLAPGCEELEAVTIMDLMVRAGIEVTSVGLDDQLVTCSRGTQIKPTSAIDDVMDRDFDMIVLPGGQPGANHLKDDPRVQALLKRHAEQDKYIGAVCAAPRALAQAGVLAGKTITAFPGSLDDMDTSGFQLQQTPVEVDGKIVTSRGPGTAMDFALTLIELLEGKSRRDEVEEKLVRS